jgi:hypothetical protein
MQRSFDVHDPEEMPMSKIVSRPSSRNGFSRTRIRQAGARAALATILTAGLGVVGTAAPAAAQENKPNVLVIMADDIGYWNISAYNRGMMGYRTPNIDRIANEGAIFTDYYGQQSCTAGRAAFITGQSPMRTGLLKVGLPGAKEGSDARRLA